jgi:DNA-binding response OmpR family regulator
VGSILAGSRRARVNIPIIATASARRQSRKLRVSSCENPVKAGLSATVSSRRVHTILPPVNQQQTIRLAVVDDDSGFVTVLGKRTEAAGWQQRTSSGAIPPEELVAMKLNALLIDPTVLGEEAWAYLERVCGMLPDLGVVVCSERSTVAQRVRGLRLGVDDWITKPCHPEEAIARLEAVSRRRRRARPQPEAGPVVAGELEIRSDRFQAFAGEVSLDLTRREFELLQLLADSPGQVLEREAIYQRVWGYAMAHGDRSVDVFIRKLRQKLEKLSPGWSYIHTHFGVGYRFDPEPAEGLALPARPGEGVADADAESGEPLRPGLTAA